MKPKKEWQKKAVIAFAVALPFLISLMFDFQIASAISYSSSELITSFFILLSKIDTITLGVIGLALVYFHNKKDLRKYSWGVLSTLILIPVLKVLILRPRPYLAGIEVPTEIISSSFSTWNTSFPSGHAVIPFFIIPFLSGKWKTSWIVVAVIIAFSRIYLGLHYLSDLIFGAVIGLTMAYLFKKKIMN